MHPRSLLEECGLLSPTSYQETERGCTPLDKHLAGVVPNSPPVRRCSRTPRLLKSPSAWAEDRALLGSNPSAVPGAGSKWGVALPPPLALQPHSQGHLAFSTHAQNPRGSGGLVPQSQQNCLKSAFLYDFCPQILRTSRKLRNHSLLRSSRSTEPHDIAQDCG